MKIHLKCLVVFFCFVSYPRRYIEDAHLGVRNERDQSLMSIIYLPVPEHDILPTVPVLTNLLSHETAKLHSIKQPSNPKFQRCLMINKSVTFPPRTAS